MFSFNVRLSLMVLWTVDRSLRLLLCVLVLFFFSFIFLASLVNTGPLMETLLCQMALSIVLSHLGTLVYGSTIILVGIGYVSL
jgi:hypothetical protein